MRRTRLVLGVCVIGLVAFFSALSACKKTGSELSGSTYCDPNAGSTEIAASSLPSGSCKGSATCIAFTAGDPCATNASVAAAECQWTCTCLDETWSCLESCAHPDCNTDGGALDATAVD